MKPTGPGAPASRIREAARTAWSEPLSRWYLVLLTVCAVWSMTGGGGPGENGWLARSIAAVLTMPWLLVVHLFLVLTQADTWLLGYSIYFESPAWLFEPLWALYCLTSGLLNARLLARVSRSTREAGSAPWWVPMFTLAFFAGLFALWRA
ncbi:SCO4225 family membrane protein [Streptomyces nojiriensis]|uniref:SCO4225 family membrane protein n=1 Tax=Streptomyces nojiriensis TaxID=66374 RepID=UPI0035DBA073